MQIAAEGVAPSLAPAVAAALGLALGATRGGASSQTSSIDERLECHDQAKHLVNDHFDTECSTERRCIGKGRTRQHSTARATQYSITA